MDKNGKAVGILTFSYSSNPGSVLQAYALQQTIADIGAGRYAASIINYQKTGADKPIFGKNIFCGPIVKWSPKKVVKWTVRWLAYPARMRKYHRFFAQYYNDFSKTPFTREALPPLSEKYDAFVVGSDQVWNFDSINVDTTYFLDFVDNDSKKISYAASFGQKGVPDDKKEMAAKLIGGFSAVSVRELEGVETVNELTGKPAEWVLDPSLIIPEERWHEMAKAPREKNYVFLYLREESPRLEQFAKALAKQYGLTVVKVLTHWKCNKKGKKQKAVGPCEWLGYMRDARYVITNSFHGICFSIAFEKEFFADLLKGGRAFTNPRISGVLEQFGLLERTIDKVDDLSCLATIDYDKVSHIKKERKVQSIRYLENAINGAVLNE